MGNQHIRKDILLSTTLVISLIFAITSSAQASESYVAFDLQANIITTAIEDGKLSISAQSPYFIFDKCTIGGGSPQQPMVADILNGKPVEILYDPITIGDKANLEV